MNKKLKVLSLLYIMFMGGFTHFCHAQSFYEIAWDGVDKISYKALLIYYSADNAYIRVKYKVLSEYRVAEYKCKCSYVKKNDGKQHFYIDGENARIVYPRNSTVGYNADNFIFTDVNSNGEFSSFYTIDDAQLNKSNYKDYYKEATYKQIYPPFTESYLYNYFDRDEPGYSKYLAIGQKNTTNYVSRDVKIHLIIAANTLDQSIGSGCKVDMENLSTEFDNISDALGISISKTIIYGKNFTKENIVSAIDNIHPRNNDVVIFFYRGHGFRWHNQESDWPQMSLRYSSFQPLVGWGLDEAYSKIIAKGARLNLVFGDLCNNDIGISYPTNFAANSLQSSFYPDIAKLRKLFILAKGNVLSAAAKSGEVSWVNNYDGGIYTSSFVESIHQEVSNISGYGDWANLIDATINKALYKSETCRSIQHGIRYVNIEYSSQ